MAGNNEVKIVFTAKTEDAANAIKEAAKKIEGLGESSKKAGSSVNKFEASLKKAGKNAKEAGDIAKKTSTSWAEMAIGLDSTINLLNRAAGLAKNAFDLARDAADFQETRDSFSKFASSVGADSDKILSTLKKASAGTVDTKNLIITASRALALGVTNDADKIGNLMEIARAKAKILGTDVTSAFNDIVTGIGRGSPQILDNLGIRIPEGFAAMTKGMDEAQKKALLLDEVLKTENETLKGMGEYSETSADRFRQLETTISELKQEIGNGLLPVTEDLVEGLRDIAKEGIEAAKGIKWLLGGGYEVDTNWQKHGAASTIASIQQTIQEKENEKQRIGNTLQLWHKALGREEGKGNTKAVEVAKEEIQKLNYEYKQLGREIKNCKKSIESVKTASHKLNEGIREAEKTGLDYYNALSGAFTFGGFGDTITDVSIKSGKNKNSSNSNGSKELEKQLDKLQKETYAGLYKAIGYTNESLSENISLMYDAGMAALGFCAQVDEAAAAEYKLSQEAEKMADEFFEAFENANKLEESINNIGRSNIENSIKELKSGNLVGGSVDLFSSVGLNVLGSASLGAANLVAARGTDDVKTTSKNFWSAIKSDYGEAMTAAMAQGIIDSNLGEAIRSTVGSIAASKASSYGSRLLGGLFSGNGFAGLGGAVSGFVGSIAIGAIANNWDKWFGDKNKSETMKSNAATIERGSNAYLQTYAAMLNPFMTSEQYYNLLDSRYASGGMTVSWKSKSRGGLAGVFGGKNYSDTTPQSTYDLIEAMEDAVEAVRKYNDSEEKRLSLMELQGQSYTVLSTQLEALGDAVNRARFMRSEYSQSWSSGEKFSIDLSDNIQDLKEAFYQALKEYGTLKGQINTQTATNYLTMAPWLSRIDTGTSGIRHIDDGSYGYDYGYWMSNAEAVSYDAFRQISTNMADSKFSHGMLDAYKQIGANQYNLQALQYSDPDKYTEAYIEMLRKQQEAAWVTMNESEKIINNINKQYEERTAALQDFQNAQDAYYNAKLEILAQEQAKEEQIKKEEAAASLRRQEQMEALLGFTGEIARTGNKVYILEGADQVGALKEMIQQYGDDPEALAALQAMLSAAQSKAKFGKIA